MDGQGGGCGTAGHQLTPGTRRCQVCGKDLVGRIDGRRLPSASHRSDVSNGSGQDSRSRVRVRAAILGVVVLVAVWALRGYAGGRDWPQECGVEGRIEWCAEPSAAMTEPDMVSLVCDYCPKLASVPLRDVAPQPLSQLNLAGEQVLAKTSGSDSSGTEEALLGRPSQVAWVTRWVGGEPDGRVEVRCFAETGRPAGLRLEADQFRSTVAAASAADARNIDFTEVARQSIPAVPAPGLGRPSFGFVSCDTTGIDLDDPATGSTFFCVTEVYGLQGKGGLREIYQVVDQSPYFESVPAGYDCTAYATASPSPAPASAGTSFETRRCSAWRLSVP